MPFVINASVVLAWIFEDESSRYADDSLGRLAGDSAVVPSIWPFEIANGLLTAERRGRLTRADADRSVELITSLPIRIDEANTRRTLSHVINLGRTHKLSSYDAAYLELAIRLGVPLASEDGDLRKAAAKVGVARV